MKLSKRVTYLTFVYFLFLGVALRVGYTPQHGGDTWSGCGRIAVISQESAVTYVLSPFAYFGWYPYSYPAGEHILLSAFQQVTGLDIGAVTVGASAFFGIFGLLSIFILARTINKDSLFTFMTILMFSTFGFVLNLSWNNISTRGLFIMFYPIVLFCLLRMFQDKEHRFVFLALSCFSFIILFSIHRIILLFIGTILLPYLIFVALHPLWKQKLAPRITNTRILSLLYLALLLTVFWLQIFRYNFVEVTLKPEGAGYSIRQIIPGSSPIVFAFNLGSTYGIFYGISAILVPLGVLSLATREKKTFNEVYILFIAFIATFFILDVEYFMSFFPVISAILAGYGVVGLMELYPNNKVIGNLYLLMLVVLSLQYLQWMASRSRFISLFIILLGILCFFAFILKSQKVIRQQDVIAFLVAGILLMTTAYASASILYMSVEYHESYVEEGGEKIAGESTIYSYVLWYQCYTQGTFFSPSATATLPLIALTGESDVNAKLRVADNEAVRSTIETEFSWDLLMNNRQKAHDYSTISRFDPEEIGLQIYMGDHHVAQMHKLNFMILPDEIDLGDNLHYYEMIPFLKESRYLIYRSGTLEFYHYGNFD